MLKTYATSNPEIPGRGQISFLLNENIMHVTCTGPFLDGHTLDIGRVVSEMESEGLSYTDDGRRAIIIEYKVSAYMTPARAENMHQAFVKRRGKSIYTPSVAMVYKPDVDHMHELAGYLKSRYENSGFETQIFGNILQAKSWSKLKMKQLPPDHFSQ